MILRFVTVIHNIGIIIIAFIIRDDIIFFGYQRTLRLLRFHRTSSLTTGILQRFRDFVVIVQ